MTPIVMPPRTEKPAEMTPVQAAAVRADIEADLEADRSDGWSSWGATFVVLGFLVAAAVAALVLTR